VLMAGDEVVAGHRMIWQILGARGVGGQQGRRFYPILVRRVDFHTQRTGFRRGAQVVSAGCPSTDGIGRPLIREREYAFGIKLILAVALRPPGLRKAIVQVDPISRGDPLQHAIEYDLPVFVFIESQVNEVIQHPPRLRDCECVDPRHVTRQRIARPAAVCRCITEKRIEITDRGEADPIDGRIPGGVRKFVDVVGYEGCSRGKQADRIAVVGILPTGCWNQLRHIVQVHAMGQRRLRFIDRRGGVAQRLQTCWAGARDVFVCGTGNGRAVRILRDGQSDGQVEIRIVSPGREVPAAPHHRVAPRRQECALGIVRGPGVIAARRAVEVGKKLGAAVRRLVKDFVVAFAWVDWLQDIEIERVFDFALGVSRRKADIDDRAIVAVGPTDFAKSLADDPFIRTDARERKATERRTAREDLDLGDARVGCGRDRQDARQQQYEANTDRHSPGAKNAWRTAANCLRLESSHKDFAVY